MKDNTTKKLLLLSYCYHKGIIIICFLQPQASPLFTMKHKQPMCDEAENDGLAVCFIQRSIVAATPP